MVVAVGSKFIYLFILYEIFKVILMCCVCVCVCVCVCLCVCVLICCMRKIEYMM